MLVLKSELVGIYKSNDFTDKKTGAKTLGKQKLQLMDRQNMQDGSIKMRLLDISIPASKMSLYTKEKIGKVVEVDVAIIGDVTYYGI